MDDGERVLLAVNENNGISFLDVLMPFGAMGPVTYSTFLNSSFVHDEKPAEVIHHII